jgi:trimeric autotransporter adhesin
MNLVRSINRSLQCAFFSIPVVVACFAFSPMAQATPDPASVGGVFNTADGSNAMPLMSAGTANSAFGAFALFSAVSSNFNTAVGAGALLNDTTLVSDGKTLSGDGNTAVGAAALFNNTISKGNTAVGAAALLRNISFNGGNTAVGVMALQENTQGAGNTAVGASALQNITGDGGWNQNTAIGQGAMEKATSGASNTAVGAGALIKTTGKFNTALGAAALEGNTTGESNIAVGINAGQKLTTGDNNIDIGNEGVAAEANSIRIGSADQTATFIAGISGANVAGGDPVFILSNGKLGTVNPPSSARFKEEIKPMNQASEVILALKPVTFRYKKEFDATRIPQFGLVAEEVEKVNPDLVKRDREGKVQTVRYEAVNAMLLNEFLKEHRTVQDLKSAAAKQKAMIARQQKQIEALTAGLQKVSAQLELNKAAPQTVLNNQ